MPQSIFWSLPGRSSDRVQGAWWGLDLVTPPVDEPITIQDVKDQARIDISLDDSYIAGLIVAARRAVEKDTNRSLLPQTWDFWLQSWPFDRIYIPRAPLISVAYLNYTDNTETVNTTPLTVYDVNTTGDPGSIVRQFGQIWPPTPLSPSRPINARFTAGYGYFTGTVTVAGGTAVTLTGGNQFDTTWTRMSRVAINDISYPIAGVTDANDLTLLTTAPNGTGLRYAYNLVPSPLKLAIQMLAAHWYQTRTPVVTGRAISSVEIAKTYDDLISNYRINTMGLNQIRDNGVAVWV